MGIKEIDFNTFNNALSKVDSVHFQQSPGWIKSRIAIGKKYIFLGDDSISPNIVIALEVYVIPFLGKVYTSEGGLNYIRGISNDTISEFLSLVSEYCKYIEINSNKVNSPMTEVAYRKAGFVRPLGGKVCPMTILLKTDQLDNYSRNWKRSIKKSKKIDGFRIEKIESPSLQDIEDFVKLFNELKELKSLSYSISVEQVEALFSCENYKLYIGKINEDAICARIVSIYNDVSYDVLAANSRKSRDNGVVFGLLDAIFMDLRDAGVSIFDFGRIGPSKGSSDSVYAFKKGSGGEVVSYSGEWVSSKSIFIEWAVFIFKYVYKKNKRW
ncbi:GNAT family N-acetyltransferase [Shewanella algae]|uniref:GNAT family N-acetyltransferase n=1 Tax=Shewanella algae TaxID=38313 RepID=UPI0005CC9BE0|nr:GNAT family N-acetyltransferase [Shewanella algae]